MTVTVLLSPMLIPTDALAFAKITPASALAVPWREPETVVCLPALIVRVPPDAPYTLVEEFPMYLVYWVVVY